MPEETYKNIGLLFNKHYFTGMTFGQNMDTDQNKIVLEAKNKVLIKSPFVSNQEPQLPGELQSLKLETVYPGLFTGSGYAHESTVTGELKPGFYFDYTSGLPCIPGSSVKGMLRSAFPDKEAIKKAKTESEKEKENSKESYIRSLMKAIDPILEHKKIDELVNEIFEENDTRSVYERDVFFDAFPVSVKQGFLGNDFITPHKDPLKNPIPLQFLKVMPGVTFEFRFRLNKGLLETDQKLELFKRILLDLGIGAKTNVGYGQFLDSEYELIDLANIHQGMEVECEIRDRIKREQENKWQIYLMPKIKAYKELLDKLKKPLPSIKVTDAQNKGLNDVGQIKCRVSRIENDGRLIFDYHYEI